MFTIRKRHCFSHIKKNAIKHLWIKETFISFCEPTSILIWVMLVIKDELEWPAFLHCLIMNWQQCPRGFIDVVCVWHPAVLCTALLWLMHYHFWTECEPCLWRSFSQILGWLPFMCLHCNCGLPGWSSRPVGKAQGAVQESKLQGESVWTVLRR